jgi:hypothetical protein
MEREATDSYMTFCLEEQMEFESACIYAEQLLPGWEAIMGCLDNPDEGWEDCIPNLDTE